MKSPSRIPLLLPALLAGIAAPALAVPFSVEGRLARVNDNVLVCNQVRIQLGPNTVITTPSGVISKAQLLDIQPFPGRRNVESPNENERSAFVGGTCIVSGDDNGNRRVADTVFVEISENVLVGPVTIPATPGGPFEIMGVPIVLLNATPGAPGYEPGGRILASDPINDFGYEVDLATVPVGDESSAEGYLTSEAFYAHTVETTGGQAKVPATAPDTRTLRGSVSRVNATTVKLEVRGGCRFMGPPNANGTARTQRINVQVDNGTNNLGEVVWANASVPTAPTAGNVTCTEDTAAPGYGLFRWQVDRYTGFRAVPTRTRATVVPSTAYPTPLYSTEFVLDRAGF